LLTPKRQLCTTIGSRSRLDEENERENHTTTATTTTTIDKHAKEMMRVNVVQYNILAPSLTEGLIVESQECFDSDLRLGKIKNKLLQHMNREEGAVICLQEVCHTFSGRLHAFFFERRYFVTWCPYGSSFSNYMGVMIAFPMARFSLLSMDVSCLADQILPFVEQALNDPEEVPLHQSGFEQSMWVQAAQRKNAMLSLRLAINGTNRTFVVATYHMPCAFRTPPVMLIHCALALNHLSKLSVGFTEPLIFCTDGNFKPFSECHSAIVEGFTNQLDVLSSRDLKSRLLIEYEKVFPEKRALYSAYWKALGKEPVFTNRSKCPEEFTDTLDYIFLNWGSWNVDRVLPLPEEPGKYLPSIEEPSDHLLLMAELSMI